MPIAWTLQRASGDERSFADWGISSAQAQFANQDVDTLDLGFGRTDLLSNLPFAVNETLLIKADGAPFFRGRIIGEKRGAYGSTEGLILNLAGPWWYLTKIIYEEQITFVSDPNANPAPANSDGLQLSDFPTVVQESSDIALLGSITDSKTMILYALAYAIAKGAPIQAGLIDTGIPMPNDQTRDVTIAELIKKCLRWTPDLTTWWDYSVNPPALNIRGSANRPLTSIDVAAGAIAQVEINPRRDLLLSGVTINYQRQHQRNNFQFVTLEKDQAGPSPEGIGALVVTIDLYGSYLIQTSPGPPPVNVIVAQEDTPVGIAASLFGTWGTLIYDGSVLLAGDDIDLTVWLSQTLCVLNGAPSWATASMTVQRVSCDLFAGRTKIAVGPPTQVSANDLVGLVRKGRTKAPSILAPSGGSGPSSNPFPPSTPAPQLQFGSKGGEIVIIAIHRVTGEPSGIMITFNIDSADIYDSRANGNLVGSFDWNSFSFHQTGHIEGHYGIAFGEGEDNAYVPDPPPSPPQPGAAHYILYQEDFDANGYKKKKPPGG